MTREELIEKMRAACANHDGHTPSLASMAAALDVAVGELLPDPTEAQEVVAAVRKADAK